MPVSNSTRSAGGVSLLLPFMLIVSGCDATPSRAAEPTHPIIAYKLGEGTTTLHNWSVAESRKVEDPKLATRIQTVMADPATYGKIGARCFDPGMGLTLTLAGKRTDAVICLKCKWVYFFDFVDGRPSDKPRAVALSDQGIQSLTQLYTEMFGK